MATLDDKEKLIGNLTNKDPLDRLNACFELAKMGEFGYLDVIATELNNNNWSIRAQALNCLGRIGSSKFIKEVSEHLQEDIIDNRNVALYALQKIGKPGVVPFLIESLKDTDEAIREDAKTALYRVLGSEIIHLVYADDLDVTEDTHSIYIVYDSMQVWWHQNKNNYDTHKSYFLGFLASPDIFIEAIKKSGNPVPDAFINLLEDWTGVSFSTKSFQQMMSEWDDWLSQYKSKFPPGKRYFYGHQIE